MNKINFQNGTLVSKAKVTVDGTVYEVEPAEYEGTTPLNAENLNQIQTNAENAINAVDTKMSGTVLYDNSSGSLDTITMSESSANYDKLKIKFKSERTGVEKEIEIINPNGKTAQCISYYYSSDTGYMYLECAEIIINTTQITWSQNIRYRVNTNAALTDFLTKITEIRGYKY